jgi:prepilin-type N-terminal cleavage/methylation domain-containing protein
MSRSLPYHHRGSPRQTGFSLIEMLVAITIMMILVGMGVAAFLTFNDRQTLVQAAKTVQGHMRAAQVKARAGDSPAGCSGLQAYAVRMAVNSNILRLVAVCENGEVAYQQHELPTSVAADSAVDIQFFGLHGGVNNPSTVTLGSQSWQYSFFVSKGGEISEGELTEL